MEQVKDTMVLTSAYLCKTAIVTQESNYGLGSPVGEGVVHVYLSKR